MARSKEPRNRRVVTRRVINALRPVLRFSKGRNAYVLRGIGNRYGPVLVEEGSQRSAGPRVTSIAPIPRDEYPLDPADGTSSD
jgi:hypothetical protein